MLGSVVLFGYSTRGGGAALGPASTCVHSCGAHYCAYKHRLHRREFSSAFLFMGCHIDVGYSVGGLCQRLKGLVRKGSVVLGQALMPCGGVAALNAPPRVCPARK